MKFEHRRLFWPVLIAVCGIVCGAEAHNGQAGVAYPLAGITVDGDLSDWPEGMRRYPILHNDDGDPTGGAGDFRGFFRVGYNV